LVALIVGGGLESDRLCRETRRCIFSTKLLSEICVSDAVITLEWRSEMIVSSTRIAIDLSDTSFEHRHLSIERGNSPVCQGTYEKSRFHINIIKYHVDE